MSDCPSICCPGCGHRQYDRSHPSFVALLNRHLKARESRWRCTGCWTVVTGAWATDHRWDIGLSEDIMELAPDGLRQQYTMLCQ